MVVLTNVGSCSSRYLSSASSASMLRSSRSDDMRPLTFAADDAAAAAAATVTHFGCRRSSASPARRNPDIRSTANEEREGTRTKITTPCTYVTERRGILVIGIPGILREFAAISRDPVTWFGLYLHFNCVAAIETGTNRLDRPEKTLLHIQGHNSIGAKNGRYNNYKNEIHKPCHLFSPKKF